VAFVDGSFSDATGLIRGAQGIKLICLAIASNRPTAWEAQYLPRHQTAKPVATIAPKTRAAG